MKVLIVYEEIPEDTTLYSVEVSAAEWEWMRLTHMKFLNTELSEECTAACNQLMEWLHGKEKLQSVAPVLMRAEGYDYVLVTGLLM